jgi:hypothetical protein
MASTVCEAAARAKEGRKDKQKNRFSGRRSSAARRGKLSGHENLYRARVTIGLCTN